MCTLASVAASPALASESTDDAKSLSSAAPCKGRSGDCIECITPGESRVMVVLRDDAAGLTIVSALSACVPRRADASCSWMVRER